MADIARRAGIGKGTVFRHFPTKDDLIAAIVLAHRAVGAGPVDERVDHLEQARLRPRHLGVEFVNPLQERQIELLALARGDREELQ